MLGGRLALSNVTHLQALSFFPGLELFAADLREREGIPAFFPLLGVGRRGNAEEGRSRARACSPFRQQRARARCGLVPATPRAGTRARPPSTSTLSAGPARALRLEEPVRERQLRDGRSQPVSARVVRLLLGAGRHFFAQRQTQDSAHSRGNAHRRYRSITPAAAGLWHRRRYKVSAGLSHAKLVMLLPRTLGLNG